MTSNTTCFCNRLNYQETTYYYQGLVHSTLGLYIIALSLIGVICSKTVSSLGQGRQGEGQVRSQHRDVTFFFLIVVQLQLSQFFPTYRFFIRMLNLLWGVTMSVIERISVLIFLAQGLLKFPKSFQRKNDLVNLRLKESHIAAENLYRGKNVCIDDSA